MLKVGLTGGIGSGKTTVAKVFETLGVPVYYADDMAKRLMQEDATLRQKIMNAFGKESYTIDGQLNRVYLSSVAFNHSKKIEQLNAIVHPVVIDHAAKWMLQQTSSYVIKEAALIFESGSQTRLDYVIGVYAPETLRIQRVTQRDKIEKEKALARINKQMEEEVKMKLCNNIIRNDDQTPLISQILNIHNQLLAKFSDNKETLK